MKITNPHLYLGYPWLSFDAMIEDQFGINNQGELCYPRGTEPIRDQALKTLHDNRSSGNHISQHLKDDRQAQKLTDR